ncbi:hypothetical protein [Streptomyces sp. NBC_01262]|uniref:hypothetical protein n=1 Tax=Streptomyces sp. NBC_01262 TaxID=2903803 RepID=UPI002E332312|nr:hypothetical protein [Streptomyces sp. NBC_01262]
MGTLIPNTQRQPSVEEIAAGRDAVATGDVALAAQIRATGRGPGDAAACNRQH